LRNNLCSFQDSAQLEWPFAEQQLINKITKELYKDQTTEFMRVEKFERGGIDGKFCFITLYTT
jgi:hypothetical protein